MAGATTTSSHPSFLQNIESIWAHTDTAPFTATFEHAIPGPANGVRSDCLWYPPRVPEPSSPEPAPTGLLLDTGSYSDDEVLVDTNDYLDTPPASPKTPKGDAAGVSILFFIPGPLPFVSLLVC